MKSIHLWWQHLVQKTNWIWLWCILLYISLHIISLSSILHDYGVLTYLASWIFVTYLVISICTLTRMNYVSNHSSIIVSAKLCSSIIGLWSALHLTPSSSFQIPKYVLYGVLRFFFSPNLHSQKLNQNRISPLNIWFLNIKYYRSR